MRWNTNEGWKWWFAIVPICFSASDKNSWIWLEWYQYRFCGDCYEWQLPSSRDDALRRQIDALLAINEAGAACPPIPGLAIELLKKCRDRFSTIPSSRDLTHIPNAGGAVGGGE